MRHSFAPAPPRTGRKRRPHSALPLPFRAAVAAPSCTGGSRGSPHAPPHAPRPAAAAAGPGFVMSIAYVDPANFEVPSPLPLLHPRCRLPHRTFPRPPGPSRAPRPAQFPSPSSAAAAPPQSDLSAGVMYGMRLLWVLLWATAAGYVIQTLAVRLALGSGLHLAQACRRAIARCAAAACAAARVPARRRGDRRSSGAAAALPRRHSVALPASVGRQASQPLPRRVLRADSSTPRGSGGSSGSWLRRASLPRCFSHLPLPLTPMNPRC